MSIQEQAHMIAVTSLTVAVFVSYLAVQRNGNFAFPAKYAGAASIVVLAWLATPASEDHSQVPSRAVDPNIERLVKNYDRIRAARIVGQVREAGRFFGSHSEFSPVEKVSLAGGE